ncbi:MAG: cysteine synthase A [Actinobacteria bacterium]|nr:cysteine synthase A [Actinomycetota bacterium]
MHTEPATTSVTRGVARTISDLIGRTPLLRLPTPDSGPDVQVIAKLEMANPLSSVKDRAALYMMRAAEQRGQLIPGSTIIEATSGNTGIALAGLAAARGYRCVIVLPDSATPERISLLRALGATVIQTPRSGGYLGAIDRAEEIHQATPGSWFPRQHENPDNVRAHYETTGPELWSDLAGRIDAFVCGVGTGGTLTGTGRYLKERNAMIEIVAVEPERSPVLSGGVGGLHMIPGLNGGFIAPTTDIGCIDRIVTVTDEDAAATTRHLARTLGLLVGISSGAAAHTALQLAGQPDYAGKVIVTLLPDTGERYLSSWPAEVTTCQSPAGGVET